MSDQFVKRDTAMGHWIGSPLRVECPFCFAPPGEPCQRYRLSVRQTAG